MFRTTHAGLAVVASLFSVTTVFGQTSTPARSASKAAPSATAESADPLASMRVDHLMVHARDFETSFAWYRDVLGFEPVVEWTVDGLEGTRLSYLRRGGFLIELVSAPPSDATAQLPRPADFAGHFAQRGFTHLCFVVDDVDAVLAILETRGVPTFAGPIDFPPLGVRVGFIQDPDGNVIEFKGPMAGDSEVGGDATWFDGAPKQASTATDDETTLRGLMDRWIEGWSPGAAKWSAEPLRPLYAEGERAIRVFDNVEGDVVQLRSFDAYAAEWEPMMAPMRDWRIALDAPAEIAVSGDVAHVSFVFSGGEDDSHRDALRITQYGTHVWQRIGGDWRIVHEHLTADLAP